MRLYKTRELVGRAAHAMADLCVLRLLHPIISQKIKEIRSGEPEEELWGHETVQRLVEEALKEIDFPEPAQMPGTYKWECPECGSDTVECNSDCGHKTVGEGDELEFVPCKEARCGDCKWGGTLGPKA